MLAWVKNVGEIGEVKEIGKGLEAMQKIVGGYIECVRLTREIDLWINEEGALEENPSLNLQMMFFDKVVNNIYGNVFFCGHDGEGNSVDLTVYQIDWLKNNMDLRGVMIDEGNKKSWNVHSIRLR